jgi:VWFA-related protein
LARGEPPFTTWQTASNQDAIFELVSIDGNGMHVLHDFTSDTKVLIAALKRVTSRLDAMAGTDTNTIHQATANPGRERRNGVFVFYKSRDQDLVDLDSTALEAFARGATPIADFAQVGAVGSTLGAFQQIAHQLSGIPGRKSLFWITGSFPFDIDETSGSISVGTPFDAYQRTMQLLNDANVSLYPVDARGVVVVGEMDATMKVSREMMRAVPEYIAGESRSHQKTLDTMRVFADTTGGKAYFNNNDLAGALSDATDDVFLLHSKLRAGHQKQSSRLAQTKSQGERSRLPYPFTRGLFRDPDHDGPVQ